MSKWSEVAGGVRSVPESEKRKIEIMAQLVEAIIARRKELGLTQEEVALRAGIRQSAVARLEGGAAIPRLDTIVKIAIGLGLDVKLIANTMAEQAAAQFVG
ncbi:MAG: helix-turn-helix domain-containing protein [Bacilli bacterium]